MPEETDARGAKPQQYDCDRCGACCKSLIVEAQWIDAAREPRLLEHTDLTLPQLNEPREAGFMPCIMLWDRKKKTCPFLEHGRDGLTNCSIHPTRPNVCVGFPAGGPQCQQVRVESGLGILLDRDGNPPDVSRWATDYEDLDYDAEWFDAVCKAVVTEAEQFTG